jgi:hypothetical protein
MNPASLTWLVVGGVLAYAVAVDPNVYHWLELQVRLLRSGLNSNGLNYATTLTVPGCVGA